MRNGLALLTIAFIFLGFAVPVLWVGAAVTGILALLASPGGTRPDGKPRSGGLLGWLIDDIVIAMKMHDCPHCGLKVMKTATKCPHCHEPLTPLHKIKICPKCGGKNRAQDYKCIHCSELLF